MYPFWHTPSVAEALPFCCRSRPGGQRVEGSQGVVHPRCNGHRPRGRGRRLVGLALAGTEEHRRGGGRLGLLAPRFAFGSLRVNRSEEHTSELQSLMRISYAVFCLNKKTPIVNN